ncbi:rhodanese-like domain-containing protein [Algoriphagus vanfongensis]|uniref:rhodanese-like domain-containing protein n=1 Tax=Algoriphagus vanfongensis TaxID=426371 RepID=UPI00041C648C|nr:rhodanese-like domain-containing protein [Algoriphagus vanfongensis]
MKSLPHYLLAVFFIIGISLSSVASTMDEGEKRLSVRQFERKINKRNTILLDVRTPEEMQKSHIPGAINLDCLSDNFKAKIEQLDKSKTYLLYCRSGIRAAKAAAYMKTKGFKKIKLLDGGFQAWTQQNKPTKTIYHAVN